MALTPEEQTTLKTHIEASVDPDVVTARDGGAHDAIAKIYNKDVSPDYYCWRSRMSIDEVRDLVDWDEVVAQSTNDLLAFQILTNSQSINPSNASVRQAFTSIFQGGQGTNTIAALNAAAKEKVSLAEKVLSLNSGDGSSGNPDTFGFEGSLSHQDISKALAEG